MKSYKARGVVLHTVKYGESGMIVFVLTDVLGRQNYMVQGIRSARSKGNKAAMFQPMFVLDFVGLESPKAQMHRMSEVRSGLILSSLPFDARKSTVALFMSETLYRLIKEVEPHSPLFGFVEESVAVLDGLCSDAEVANFHLWFMVRLSAYLGFYPGNEYIPGGFFDIEEGLFVPSMPPHGVALDAENSRLLDRFMSVRLDELAAITLSRTRRSAFLTALLSYFGYHLDSIHSVRSLDILRDVF